MGSDRTAAPSRSRAPAIERLLEQYGCGPIRFTGTGNALYERHEQPDNWLRRPDPWEVARLQEQVEVKPGCSFEVRGGSLGVVVGRPSSLLGLPFDRPVVGYGGRTINTLRLWAAAAPDVFDFEVFSAGEFVSALAERLTAESLTRVLYPDDSTSMGQGLRFVQEYFLVVCSLADLVRRFRRSNSDWGMLPDKVAIQLNDTHPRAL
jgi:starch phosphorylase